MPASLLIAFLVVGWGANRWLQSFQTIEAAFANPVTSLRSESLVRAPTLKFWSSVRSIKSVELPGRAKFCCKLPLSVLI